MAHQDDLFAGPGGPTPSAALSTTRVIPLGKYKGQSFDVLSTDSAYALWMLSSMYAKLELQHPALLAFLVGRYGLPERTPVHNALQNKFLDEAFCVQFALASAPHLREAAKQLATSTLSLEAAWRQHIRTNLMACLHLSEWQSNKSALESGTTLLEATRSTLQKDWPKFQLYGATGSPTPSESTCSTLQMSGLVFEEKGADVSFSVAMGYELVAKQTEASAGHGRAGTIMLSQFSARGGFRIEVKPVVGDDYPAVLRRMKTAQNSALLIGEYNGVGASWGDLVKVFALSNISVVRLADVELVDVPQRAYALSTLPLTDGRAQSVLAHEHAEHLAALADKVAQRPEPDSRLTGWQGDTPF